MNHFALACAALLLEGFMGYPAILQSYFQHPVQWIGRLITYIDDGLNDEEATPNRQRINGVIALLVLISACALPAVAVQLLLTKLPYGWILNILLATPFIAQHSLSQHVASVATLLPISLSQARSEVAKIVGRDPSHLDEAGVAKATLESLAENTSDGIVAPIFWYALLGLPGLVVYKAINTADSMIGHKNEKYLNFGWASARLDDLVNLPASRLTGTLFCAAALVRGKPAAKNAWAAMRQDAPKHNSPNAGWPEAAMAGALGLQFGGPRDYEGETVILPSMGQGRAAQNSKDIADGLHLMHNAMALFAVILVILAIAL